MQKIVLLTLLATENSQAVQLKQNDCGLIYQPVIKPISAPVIPIEFTEPQIPCIDELRKVDFQKFGGIPDIAVPTKG